MMKPNGASQGLTLTPQQKLVWLSSTIKAGTWEDAVRLLRQSASRH